MPSFDIISKVDSQMLDNAINVTQKEVANRFDFKDSIVKIDLNKKDNKFNYPRMKMKFHLQKNVMTVEPKILILEADLKLRKLMMLNN